MKTESDIRKRIQQHQDIIDHLTKEIEKEQADKKPDTTLIQNYYHTIGKEQAIINELKKILEE